MKQAEWNDITWGHSGNQAAYLKSIELSQSLNTTENKNEKGQNKLVVNGLDAEELSVTYTAGLPIGLDPRGEFEILKKCAGKQDEFYLAGSPISKQQFELDSIEMTNTVLDNNGRILVGDITLKFNTESNPSTKGGKGKKKKGKKGKKGKKSSLTLKPGDIAKAKSMAGG